MEKARSFGLVSFVWGDDLDNQRNQDYFRKEIMVDGIIYDRIGENESRQNVFTVERGMKSALFRSPSPSRTSSLEKASIVVNGLDPATNGVIKECNNLESHRAVEFT